MNKLHPDQNASLVKKGSFLFWREVVLLIRIVMIEVDGNYQQIYVDGYRVESDQQSQL